jgi:FkbM family methyltransferase
MKNQTPLIYQLKNDAKKTIYEGIRQVYWNIMDLYSLIRFHTTPDEIRQTNYGFKLLVNRHDFAEQRFVSDKHVAEKDMFEYFLDEISSSNHNTFVDIGANVGIYSVLFAVRHQRSNHVKAHAFEPLQRNVQRIEKNKRINSISEKSIEIHDVALSNRQEITEIKHEPWNYGSASLASRQSSILKRTERVECKKLDDYSHEISKIDLIKIDVEGWENHVLKGGEEILQRDRPDLIIEIHPEDLEDQNQSIKGLLEHLSEYGYNKVIGVENKLEFNIDSSSLSELSQKLRNFHAIHVTQ